MAASEARRRGVSYRIRHRIAPHPVCLLRESGTLYRSRRPERTALYQLFERHFDRLPQLPG